MEMLMALDVKPHLYVAVDERGFRIGETHHNATISDQMVDMIRDLFEYDGLKCQEIAERTGIAKSTIVKICRYERRASRPHRWKRLDGKDHSKG